MQDSKKTSDIKDIVSKEKTLLKGAFYSDSLLAFVYKKAERLSIAIYMVTSFINEEEPIRSRLREYSLELLKNISNLDGSSGEISVYSSKTVKNFFEIASTLDIAVNSGMISEMNYKIIKEVILELMGIVESNFDIKNPSRTLLNPDFFSIKDILLEDKRSGEDVIKDIYKGQYYKRQNDVLYKNSENIYLEKDSYQNKPLNKENQKIVRVSENFKPKNTSSKAKDRQKIILDLLKNKREITVNEVALVIKDCSEKTLQRDLLRMVDDGILAKEGERRWSKYTLSSK